MEDPKYKVGNHVRVEMPGHPYTGLVFGVRRTRNERRYQDKEKGPQSVEEALAYYVYTIACDECGHTEEWSQQRLSLVSPEDVPPPKCYPGTRYAFYPTGVEGEPIIGDVVKVHRSPYRWVYDISTNGKLYPGVAEELIICN